VFCDSIERFMPTYLQGSVTGQFWRLIANIQGHGNFPA
jgi:hypothetical protein